MHPAWEPGLDRVRDGRQGRESALPGAALPGKGQQIQ